ncbi:hypothetical protein M758_1G287100 [Ceratodon purpureus]|nr:hypothetical protein M758_1G287100 [Ceratodon purpureus]
MSMLPQPHLSTLSCGYFRIPKSDDLIGPTISAARPWPAGDGEMIDTSETSV